jgi:16S rRNA G527 N7-methylase RsmG
LRAVITRLIKPTDDVRAIFHKWGVVDAKQALATFGGLKGVLKKLSEETGGSSQEFATLLRNVRAISGAMGIMVDDGKLMAEVLGEIENSTEKANAAWAEFAESESFRFQQATTQLSNELLRLGQVILPGVLSAAEGLSDWTRDLAMGFRRLSGEFDEMGVRAEVHNRLVASGVEKVRELEKAQAEANKDTYTPLRTAALAYYAEANKQEFALQNVRGKSIATAANVMTGVAKQLDGVYSRAFKSLDDFSQKLSTRIKANLDALSGVGDKLADAYTKVQLKRATTDAERLKIYEAAVAKAARASAESTKAVGADEASQKKALADNAKLVSLREKQLDLAISLGKSTRELDELQGKYLRSIAEETTIRNKANLAMKAAAPVAREQALALAEVKSRLIEIAKEEKAIVESGDNSARNTERLVELQKQRADLQKQGADAAAKAADLGLDLDFDTVVDGLTRALDTATKDWSAEVDKAQAAFDAQTIQIRTDLDPSGLKRKIGEALDVQQLPGETVAQFYGKIDEAAAQAAETEVKRLDTIRNKTAQLAPLLFNLQGLYESLGDASDLAAEKAAIGFAGPKATDTAAGLAKKLGYDEASQSQQNFAREQRDINLALQRGHGLSQEAIDAFSTLVTKEQQAGNLTDERVSKLRTYLKIVREINNLTQQRNEAEAPGIDAATLESINQLNVKSKETLEATSATKAEAASAAGGELNTTLGTTPSAAASSYAAIDGMTARLAAATRQAHALNAALAAGGGGAVAAHHGGRFFANGGLVRGQDRIAASLESGETVVNKKGSARFFSELNAMNQGSQPVFREQGGSVTNVGDVNVSVNGGDSSQQTVREIGHQLRREIQRGNIKLR